MTKEHAMPNGKADEQPQFNIQRIYTKDVSFEAPRCPEIFQEEWEPDMHMDMQTQSKQISEGVYEVELHLTVTVKNKQKSGFLAEVKQAGIFTVQKFPEEQHKHLLGSYCPSIIYPYAREVISDIVIRGTFPQLILAPLNFDALYQRQLEEEAKQKASATNSEEKATQ